MNPKARVEQLEKDLVARREVKDGFIFFVGVPSSMDDPGGQILAAGIQHLECNGLQWNRGKNESEDEFRKRAVREALPAKPGSFVRLFIADYGDEKTLMATEIAGQ